MVDDDAPSALIPHVSAVAAESDVSETALRTLAERLHASVVEYPGVSDLVFEYRRAFSHDPLVDRVDDVYYLLVPPHVWPEFGAVLDADEDALAALRSVHERAFDDGVALRDRGDWEPIVLVG